MAARVSAIGRCGRQNIVVVDVAGNAGDVGMPVGEQEPRCAVVQLAVVWQMEQFAAANCPPEVECAGLLVCCQVVKWQPEFPQSVGAVVKI